MVTEGLFPMIISYFYQILSYSFFFCQVYIMILFLCQVKKNTICSWFGFPNQVDGTIAHLPADGIAGEGWDEESEQRWANMAAMGMLRTLGHVGFPWFP